MAFESLRKDLPSENIKPQYRTGIRVEQYRISGDYLFMPRERYLPLDAIEKIQVRRSLMNSGHCCGMGFPVYNLIVFYGGERPARLMVEKEKNAKKLAGLITKARESIVWEEYRGPDVI